MEQNEFNTLIESLSSLTNEQKKIVFSTIIPEFYLVNPNKDTAVLMTENSLKAFLSDNVDADVYTIVSDEMGAYEPLGVNQYINTVENIYEELFVNNGNAEINGLTDFTKREIYNNVVEIVKNIVTDALTAASEKAVIKTEWETIVDGFGQMNSPTPTLGNYQRYLREVVDKNSILKAYPINEIK